MSDTVVYDVSAALCMAQRVENVARSVYDLQNKTVKAAIAAMATSIRAVVEQLQQLNEAGVFGCDTHSDDGNSESGEDEEGWRLAVTTR